MNEEEQAMKKVIDRLGSGLFPSPEDMIKFTPKQEVYTDLEKKPSYEADPKYYIPNIEDIRIGYECEIWWNENMLPENEWCSIKVFEQDNKDFDLVDYSNRIYNKEIRTPYLTKEQIEAEGWKFYESKLKPLCFKKKDYHLYFYEGDKTMTISQGIPPMWLNFYYNGNCPSINEFRTIIKLLGI